jgi:hypothetical protein
MGLAPGNYDGLAALDSASVSAQPAPTADGLPAAPPQPASVFSFVAEGRPVVSMSGFLVTLDDSIQLTVWNSNAALTSVTLQLRILRPDGTIVTGAYALNNITANRAANVLTVSQIEGYLVGAVVGQSGVAVQRGQMFVSLAVVRGTASNPLFVETLIADYLTSAFQPSWPQGEMRSAVEGAGFLYTALEGFPGFGADLALALPAATRWRVAALETILTTSAAAGNRQVNFQITQGGQAIFRGYALNTQGPSQTITYSYGVNLPLAAIGTLSQTVPLPDALFISAPAQITTLNTNLQAGDSFNGLQVAVEEWINV